MGGRTGNRTARVGWAAAGLILLAVTGGQPWPSSNPAEFMVAPDVLARLQTLADGLHNEIVLCLKGRIRGDTALVEDFVMPTPRESTPMRSSFDPCPSGTLASWHNHPPSQRMATAALQVGPVSRNRVRRLCVLSGTDIETAQKLAYPFVVVAVDGRTWCWWSLDEVEQFAIRSISPGPPAPGRLAEDAAQPAWSSPRADPGPVERARLDREGRRGR